MAGIFGCFRFLGKRDLVPAAEVLRHGVRQGSDYEEMSLAKDHFHLGYAMPRKQNGGKCLYSSADGNYALLLFGQFFLPSGHELSSENFESEFITGFQRS